MFGGELALGGPAGRSEMVVCEGDAVSDESKLTSLALQIPSHGTLLSLGPC